jgi:hypothetical protein
VNFTLHRLVTALPDEIFASVLLRTASHQRSSIYDITPFKRGSSLRYAGHLNALHRALPRDGTLPEKIIPKLCIYTYLAPFIEPVYRVRHLRWALQFDNIKVNLGWRSGRPPQPTFFRLCPDCTEEDRKAHGEAYFHRQHQLPGINVCLKHGLRLVDSACDIRIYNPYPAAACMRDHPAPNREDLKVPSQLADYIQSALDFLSAANPFRIPQYNFRQIYLSLFSFGRPTKSQIDELIGKIEAKYGKCLVDAFAWDTWSRPSIFHFVRRARTSDSLPLVAHLILLHYLKLPFPEALGIAASNFVWACPNGYCESYGKLSLGQPVRHKSSVIVKCSACAIELFLSPETRLGAIPKIVRLVDPGSTLVDSIRRDLDAGRNLREIALKARMSLRHITNAARDSGLVKSPIGARQSYATSLRKRLTGYKDALLRWNRENPSGTRTQMKYDLGQIFQRLREAAPEWTEENMPKKRPRGARAREILRADEGAIEVN